MKRMVPAAIVAALLTLTACGDAATSSAGDRPATSASSTTTSAQHDHSGTMAGEDGGPIGAQPRSNIGTDPIPDLASDQVAQSRSTDGLYGWGAWQPAQMNRPLVGGTSKTAMTPERRSLLGRQLVQAREAALAVGTVAEAEAAGYVKLHGPVSGRGLEYGNFAYMDKTFDIAHPEILAFPDDAPDTTIAAIAYYVLAPDASHPPTELPVEAIPWHYHWSICRKGDTFPLSQDVQGCKDLGGTSDHSLDGWMVDLWVVPGWENPWGLISGKHPDLITK